MILSRNKINQINLPKVLESFPNIQVLDLSQNQIISLNPNKYKCNSNIKKLLLSRNSLTSLEDFNGIELSSLEFLGLFGNFMDREASFEEITLYFTSQLQILATACPQIENLSIDGNPLSEKLIAFE